MVRRVLYQHSAEIGFRTEITRRHTAIYRVVTAAGGFEVIVAMVAKIAEAGFAHTHRQRQERNLLRADPHIRGLYQPIIETIIHHAYRGAVNLAADNLLRLY